MASWASGRLSLVRDRPATIVVKHWQDRAQTVALDVTGRVYVLAAGPKLAPLVTETGTVDENVVTWQLSAADVALLVADEYPLEITEDDATIWLGVVSLEIGVLA